MFKQLLTAAALAGALMSPAGAGQGDPDRGRVISFTCAGCHGIPFHQNVYPTYSVPRIGGQTEGYIVAALRAYRSGERRHPTMQAQGNTLSDQDIIDIAAYLAGLGGNSE